MRYIITIILTAKLKATMMKNSSVYFSASQPVFRQHIWYQFIQFSNRQVTPSVTNLEAFRSSMDRVVVYSSVTGEINKFIDRNIQGKC